MAEQKKSEPQSYGGQSEWVKGDVGQTVNRQKDLPGSQHADFYESRRESEESAPEQGGQVSGIQLAENDQVVGPARISDVQPSGRVATADGGAKRGSYFKDRDYK